MICPLGREIFKDRKMHMTPALLDHLEVCAACARYWPGATSESVGKELENLSRVCSISPVFKSMQDIVIQLHSIVATEGRDIITEQEAQVWLNAKPCYKRQRSADADEEIVSSGKVQQMQPALALLASAAAAHAPSSATATATAVTTTAASSPAPRLLPLATRSDAAAMPHVSCGGGKAGILSKIKNAEDQVMQGEEQVSNAKTMLVS
jgi:hypothetical protein